MAAMPFESQQRLFPYLKLEHIQPGKVLHEAGDDLSKIYFPIDSIAVLVHLMDSGAFAALAMVGNEGLVGTAALMGGACTACRAVILRAGHAYAISAPQLLMEIDRNGDVRTLLLRYLQSQFAHVAQTAACNRYHTIEQQFCGWLLMSLDRLPGNTLIMTQELIANMLGVRREGVSEAAAKLQELGVIHYKRGQITVLHRSRLKQLSCECYDVVKDETHRMDIERQWPQAG